MMIDTRYFETMQDAVDEVGKAGFKGGNFYVIGRTEEIQRPPLYTPSKLGDAICMAAIIILVGMIVLTFTLGLD